jgi:hypothetical protein
VLSAVRAAQIDSGRTDTSTVLTYLKGAASRNSYPVSKSGCQRTRIRVAILARVRRTLAYAPQLPPMTTFSGHWTRRISR